MSLRSLCLTLAHQGRPTHTMVKSKALISSADPYTSPSRRMIKRSRQLRDSLRLLLQVSLNQSLVVHKPEVVHAQQAVVRPLLRHLGHLQAMVEHLRGDHMASHKCPKNLEIQTRLARWALFPNMDNWQTHTPRSASLSNSSTLTCRRKQ